MPRGIYDRTKSVKRRRKKVRAAKKAATKKKVKRHSPDTKLLASLLCQIFTLLNERLPLPTTAQLPVPPPLEPSPSTRPMGTIR